MILIACYPGVVFGAPIDSENLVIHSGDDNGQQDSCLPLAKELLA